MPLDNDAIPEVRPLRLMATVDPGHDRILGAGLGDVAEIRFAVPGSDPAKATSVSLAAGSSGEKSVADPVTTIEGDVPAGVIAHLRRSPWRVSWTDHGEAPEVSLSR